MHAMMCAPPRRRQPTVVAVGRALPRRRDPRAAQAQPYFLKLRKDADYKREPFSCWDVNSCARGEPRRRALAPSPDAKYQWTVAHARAARARALRARLGVARRDARLAEERR